METRHDALRDELVAILGAGRELTPEADHQLAEAFIRYLEREQEQEATDVVPVVAPHQPHYSLKLAGGAWGATLMFLFLLLLLSNSTPAVVILTSVVLLSLVAVVTRAFLYMARHGWRLPAVRVTIAPPNGKASGRK